MTGYNFACAENFLYIANGFLHIEGVQGHKLANIWLTEVAKNYNPKGWSENGPKMITRVANSICESKSVFSVMYNDKCQYNFKVYPAKMCYFLTYYETEKFFDKKYEAEVFERLKESVITHVWNAVSHKLPLTRDSDVPYVKIAKKYCPKSIASSYEF